MKFRSELETLKTEIASLRDRLIQSKAEDSSNSTGVADEKALLSGLPHQIQNMLKEAEGSVTAHPVATLTGVFALGVAVGRLTAK